MGGKYVAAGEVYAAQSQVCVNFYNNPSEIACLRDPRGRALSLIAFLHGVLYERNKERMGS